jgi:hypothetical protein
MWLRNRRGRWVNGYTVIDVGQDRNKTTTWAIRKHR